MVQVDLGVPTHIMYAAFSYFTPILSLHRLTHPPERIHKGQLGVTHGPIVIFLAYPCVGISA